MAELASTQDYLIEFIRANFELLEDEEEGMAQWLAQMYDCIEAWRFDEGQRLIQAIKGLNLSTYATGQFYVGMGDLYRQQQLWTTASHAYQRALTCFRHLNKLEDEALALNQLALALQEQQDYEQAIRYYKETITVYEALGDIHELGRVFINLGSVADAQTDWQQAIAYYQQGVGYLEQANAKEDLATALNNLGVALESLGNFVEAEHYYMRCIDLLDELGQTYSTEGIRILANLGQLYAKQANWEKAITCYQSALKICEEIEDVYNESRTWNNLGTVYVAKSDYRQAAECYQRSIELHHQLGDRQGESLALSNLGAAYADLGELTLAETCYCNSLLVGQELDDPYAIARSHNNLGVLYETQKRYDNAIDHYKQCIIILRDLGDGHREVSTLINICTLYAGELLEPEEALPYFDRAWEVAKARGYIEHLTSLCLLQGDIAFQYSDRFPEAYEWCSKACQYASQLNAKTIDQVIQHINLHIERFRQRTQYKELRDFCMALLKVCSEDVIYGQKPEFIQTLQKLAAAEV